LSQFITTKGKFYITPAFICLIIIESSDIAFAFDSVPAIIAITQEPILVYAAIIFAILGLRSLYFVLAILAKFLIYLETTVIILLFFIAIKMSLQFCNHTIIDTGYNITPNQSLIIVLTILGIGIVLSLIAGDRTTKQK
jgi:tellurite resistance protein TerC